MGLCETEEGKKVFLLASDSDPNYFIGRHSEDTLKAELTKDMKVGSCRKVGDGLYLFREK